MTQRGAILEAAEEAQQKKQRPRRKRARRVAQAVVLVILVGIIGGYWAITDSERVRRIAEEYLSKEIGGKVSVERASLSLFEGLRLEGVSVWVDEPPRADSKVFEASTFWVKADLWGLLSGKLENARIKITALGPRAHLCEDLDREPGRDTWNYQRLKRRDDAKDSQPRKNAEPPALPEIVLRGGVVEYSRIWRGRHEVCGHMALDGQLTPAADAPVRYAFDLDSRAPGEVSGPRLRGVLDTREASVEASLENVSFDRTTCLMLPSQVQQWWTTHQLSGRLRIPKFRYVAGGQGKDASFEIEVELKNVKLTVPPQELIGHDYPQVKQWRPGFAVAASSPFELIGRTEAVARVVGPEAIKLTNVSGRFVFTPQEIRFCGVNGQVENNNVRVDGTVGGYSADDPMHLRLVANNMQIPEIPRFLGSLPLEAQREYAKFRPVGRANLGVELRRTEPSGFIETRLELHVLDGGFTFEEFKYPLRKVRGTVAYGRDPVTRRDWVSIRNLTGYGVEDGPNRNNRVQVNGWISPLKRSSGIDVWVKGEEACLEEPLRRALPVEAREVLELFDRRPGRSEKFRPEQMIPVQMRGGYQAHLHRQYGSRRLLVDVDLSLKDGNGEFSEFGYPLRNVSGDVRIRPDHVEFANVVSRQGDTKVRVDGQVSFGKGRPVEPDLNVEARNVPIDEDLLWALPKQQRVWLEKIALGGIIDVNGRVFLAWKDAALKAMRPVPKGAAEIDFDLGIEVRDGRMWPVKGDAALKGISAALRLSRSRLTLDRAEGKRGDAVAKGRGRISWPDDRLNFALDVAAESVAADDVIYEMIPEGAREAWDRFRPVGRGNLNLSYRGGEDEGETFSVSIAPKGMTITPVDLPWRMEAVGGEMRIERKEKELYETISLEDIVLKHGAATVKLNGSGATSGPWERLARNLVEGGLAQGLSAMEMRPWQLSFSAQGITVDDELLAALPREVSSLLRSIKLKGTFSIDVPRLCYRTTVLGESAGGSPGSTLRTETEFAVKIGMAGAALDPGLALSGLNGAVEMSGLAINGDLDRLTGTFAAASLQMAERAATELKGNLIKHAGKGTYQFYNASARLCGGLAAARQIDLVVPEQGPAQYGLSLALKDMNVHEILGETPQQIRGKIDASLSLAGNWDDARTRRGSGDVLVRGENLYAIPVPFGFLQIVNLALPIKSPFHEATAHYNIEGERLVLDPIELRAQNMLMQGSGTISFTTRELSLVFITNNPRWPRISWLDDLKRDLLHIRVSGKVHEPKVSAKAMSTFSTTIDEVLRGESDPVKKKEKKQRTSTPGF